MTHNASDINSSVEFRNRLISALLHDAKGLAANVFWMMEMIETGLDSGSVRNLIPELKTIAAKNAEDLNDLSQWIKAQKDASEIHVKEIDLNIIFFELKNTFTEQLAQKNLGLIITSTEFPQIYSDHFLLKLVLKNILKSVIECSENQEKIVVSYEMPIDGNEIIITFQKIDARHISENFDIAFAKETALLLGGKILIGDDCIFLTMPLKTKL